MTEEDLEHERDADMAWALSKPQGRRLIHRLAFDRALGMKLRSPAVPGDDSGTMRNVGRQELANDILALAEATDGTLFRKMMREAFDESRVVERPRVPPDGDASIP